MVSNTHLICAQGFYVAIISATVETNEPEKEIQPAIDILGDIMDMFVSISDLYDINEGN
jgi:Rab GDP dissociation inhibitor